MCGNPYSTTPTVDSADLMAIIHPSASSAFQGGRLRLSNRLPGATLSVLVRNTNNASDSSSDASDSEADGDGASEAGSASLDGFRNGEEVLHVRIHKYGLPIQSLTLTPTTTDANPVLHSFRIAPDASTSAKADSRLSLTAGGEGVVGRTVSIVDSRCRVLGEGVIGWC